MKDGNLKSCPFCGSEEVSIESGYEGDDGLDNVWIICCANCPAEMRGARSDCPTSIFPDEKEEIIAAWNCRAGETSKAKMTKAPDGAWIKLTENPFGHACCDCGLYHRVEWVVVDENEDEIPLPEGARLGLRFVRDQGETKRIRGEK